MYENHALLSCERCRRQHKKCDRKIPSCGLCASGKRECVYNNNSDKRSSKPRVKKNIDEDNDSTSIDEESLSTAWDKIRFCMPIMSKDRLINILQYIKAEPSMEKKDPNIFPEELSFVLSILLQSTLCVNTCQFYFEKARSTIGPVLDRIFDNLMIAACCAYLGSYCAVQNNMNSSKFYYSNVHTFLTHHKLLGTVNPHITFLELEYNSTLELMKQDVDTEKLFKEFVLRHYTAHQYFSNNPERRSYFEISPVMIQPWVTRSEMQSLLTEVGNDSNQDGQLATMIIDRFAQAMNGFYDRLFSSIPKPEFEQRKMCVMMFVQGAQMQRYIKINRFDLARRCADRITAVLINNQIIDSRITGALLIAACDVQLKFFEESQDECDRRDIVAQLNSNYHVLKKMSTSFPYVNKYQTTCARLENAIWTYTNDQNKVSNQLLSSELLPVMDDDFLTKEDIESFLNHASFETFL
ncbi:nitrogen assimilation transcription factor nit-4 [Acrasis kona]|uniref:Nitrogen assimilation transcription factor nit-4 n=1 Tax=Acrasis kona TaxID=1008807 RepID=A0AAW2YZC8_9EUKA